MESWTSTTKPEPHRQSAADALTFNVASLLSESLGTIRDLEVSAPPMVLVEGLEQTRGTTGRLRLTRTNRGLFVHARFGTGLAQSCSRCLRDLDWPVEIEIDEEALPTVDVATGKPVDIDAEPDALRITDHHELELESEVRDAIELGEPIAPLCREDCPGLCLVCGLELGSGPHDHPDDDIDPRLEGLRRLVDAD